MTGQAYRKTQPMLDKTARPEKRLRSVPPSRYGVSVYPTCFLPVEGSASSSLREQRGTRESPNWNSI
jgi:hypothetical protein